MKPAMYWLIAAAVVIAVGACAAREEATKPAPATKTRAEERKERAAHAICTEAYGPEAMHFWTKEGHLVCRRGRLL